MIIKITNNCIIKGDIVEECIIPYDMIPMNTNALINYRFIWPDISFKAAKELGVDVQFSGYCLPLGFGAIYNHSKDPNCYLKPRLIYFCASTDHKRLVTTVMELYALEDIPKDTEITTKYTLYEMDN